MRSLKKNMQKLYFATYSEEIPVYETDDDGNIIDEWTITTTTKTTEIAWERGMITEP